MWEVFPRLQISFIQKLCALITWILTKLCGYAMWRQHRDALAPRWVPLVGVPRNTSWLRCRVIAEHCRRVITSVYYSGRSLSLSVCLFVSLRGKIIIYCWKNCVFIFYIARARRRERCNRRAIGYGTARLYLYRALRAGTYVSLVTLPYGKLHYVTTHTRVTVVHARA